MRFYFTPVLMCGLLVSSSVFAGLTVAPEIYAELIEQYIQEGTNLDALKNVEKADETQKNNAGTTESLAGTTETATPPQATLKEEDTLPFTSPELDKELKKENPSVPAVEALFKKEFYIDSESIHKNVEMEKVKATKNDAGKNTAEYMQQQSHLSFENARALAIKAGLIAEQQTSDFNELKKEMNALKNNVAGRNSTAMQQRGINLIIYKSNAILNEISILRNSYLEIESLNALQGTQQTEKE